MYCIAKEKPHQNIINGKINSFFVKGYFQENVYYAEREAEKIELEQGKSFADLYWSGWLYGKNKRYKEKSKAEYLLLFNKQIQEEEPIHIGNDEFTDYMKMSMNLKVMRAFSDNRREKILKCFPQGANIEIYHSYNRKPHLAILLPIEEQDEPEFIAYRLVQYNGIKTKVRLKNMDRHLTEKKYEVGGRINVVSIGIDNKGIIRK